MKGFLGLFLTFNCRKKKNFVVFFKWLEVFTHLSILNIALIGKYIEGNGIKESLRQTQVFRVNVVDTILNGTNYVRLTNSYLILANVIENGRLF